MIRILMGPKGAGKTKAFIDMVNTAVTQEMGNVVCVTMNNRHLFDLKSSVRMVNTTEFEVKTYEEMYGFICGIISGNYDITHIFIDSITKILPPDFEKLDELLVKLENISERNGVSFTITVSSDVADATYTINKYLIEI